MLCYVAMMTGTALVRAKLLGMMPPLERLEALDAETFQATASTI
jgi:hypothetical protein